MEAPPPSYRSPSISYSAQNSKTSTNGDTVDTPGLFDGPSGIQEDFTDASEGGNFLTPLTTEDHMRQLRFIDKLHDLGIDLDGIDLPRLVVCGDQSSGG